MAAVHRRPGYEHVTGRAAGVWDVPFLKNHFPVPHVAVHKVDPKVGARRHPPLAAPHYKTNVIGRSRKGDPTYPGVRCVRCFCSLRGAFLTILGLFVGFQQPLHKLHLVLRNTKLSSAYNPKRMDPCQSSAMYTLPQSVCQKYSRAEKPPQLIFLRCSLEPTCKKTSIHPTPLGSRPAWASQEGRHQR